MTSANMFNVLGHKCEERMSPCTVLDCGLKECNPENKDLLVSFRCWYTSFRHAGNFEGPSEAMNIS